MHIDSAARLDSILDELDAGLEVLLKISRRHVKNVDDLVLELVRELGSNSLGHCKNMGDPILLQHSFVVSSYHVSQPQIV